MSRSARIAIFAVLFCAWSGTNAQVSEDGSCSGYGYGAQQEQQWGACWPDCKGDRQSPIDVEPQDATTLELPYLDGPFYRSRNVPFRFSLSNDNYTVTMYMEDADYLYLEGGPLNGRYYLHNMQFCWGSDDSMGSDHAFKGQRYTMEGQWALYNKDYGTYEEASKQPGGVLRISQMYPVQKRDNPSFAPIVEALPYVVEPGDVTTPNATLSYDGLFSGYPVDDYYFYNGSFTTPPCSETVMWLVFPPLNGVSEEQVEAFRQLQSTDGPLVNNFRSLQPLDGRQVIRSDKSSSCLGECDSSAASSERLLAGKRRRASKSGRRGRHGPAGRRGAAGRRHH